MHSAKGPTDTPAVAVGICLCQGQLRVRVQRVASKAQICGGAAAGGWQCALAQDLGLEVVGNGGGAEGHGFEQLRRRRDAQRRHAPKRVGQRLRCKVIHRGEAAPHQRITQRRCQRGAGMLGHGCTSPPHVGYSPRLESVHERNRAPRQQRQRIRVLICPLNHLWLCGPLRAAALPTCARACLDERGEAVKRSGDMNVVHVAAARAHENAQ